MWSQGQTTSSLTHTAQHDLHDVHKAAGYLPSRATPQPWWHGNRQEHHSQTAFVPVLALGARPLPTCLQL